MKIGMKYSNAARLAFVIHWCRKNWFLIYLTDAIIKVKSKVLRIIEWSHQIAQLLLML